MATVDDAGSETENRVIVRWASHLKPALTPLQFGR